MEKTVSFLFLFLYALHQELNFSSSCFGFSANNVAICFRKKKAKKGF